MSKNMTTIAGLPVEKFLNRRVRLVNQHAGHRKTGTLLEVHANGKVTVKPDQHRDTEVVDIDRVHPWWSQNPDLKQEYDDMLARQEIEAIPDFLEEDEETQEENLAPPDPKLPAMELPAGVDFGRVAELIHQLKDAMIEEEEVKRLMQPALQRQAETRKSLEKMGVKLKGAA